MEFAPSEIKVVLKNELKGTYFVPLKKSMVRNDLNHFVWRFEDLTVELKNNVLSASMDKMNWVCEGLNQLNVMIPNDMEIDLGAL